MCSLQNLQIPVAVVIFCVKFECNANWTIHGVKCFSIYSRKIPAASPSKCLAFIFYPTRKITAQFFSIRTKLSKSLKYSEREKNVKKKLCNASALSSWESFISSALVRRHTVQFHADAQKRPHVFFHYTEYYTRII